VGTDQDTLLATITDVDDTTFADASALHEVDYLYSVVVSNCPAIPWMVDSAWLA